jgi:hypothetical protein
MYWHILTPAGTPEAVTSCRSSAPTESGIPSPDGRCFQWYSRLSKPTAPASEPSPSKSTSRWSGQWKGRRRIKSQSLVVVVADSVITEEIKTDRDHGVVARVGPRFHTGDAQESEKLIYFGYRPKSLQVRFIKRLVVNVICQRSPVLTIGAALKAPIPHEKVI